MVTTEQTDQGAEQAEPTSPTPRGDAFGRHVGEQKREYSLDPRRLVPIIAALAAIVGVLSGTAPTGGRIIDILLTAGLVALVVFAAVRAPQQQVLWMCLVAFVFAGFQPWIICGLVAFASYILITEVSRVDFNTHHVAVAAIAGLAMQSLLRLPDIRWVGTSALLAAVAIFPLLWAVFREADSEVKRRIRRIALGVFVFCVVATGLAVLAAFQGRTDVESGIRASEAGLQAARNGNQDRAVERLTNAQGLFSSARSTFRAPWTWPARLVPVVSQHTRALDVAATQGEALTDAAIRAALTAELDDLRGLGGRVNLEQIAEVGVELSITQSTLDGASNALEDIRSPWLLPVLNDRLDEVDVELEDARDDIDLAAKAGAVVPDMLGASGPRNYLVMFTTPSEAREIGGFAGSYAVLRASDGRLDLVVAGRSEDLNAQATLQGVADPESYPNRYIANEPERFFGNLTGTPDFPTLARATAEVFPQMGGVQLDGVMMLDPYAVAALLELSGPVAVEGLDYQLDADNAADFLLREQYLLFDYRTRSDLLGEIAEKAFDVLLSSDIPSPERLGEVLGPVARQQRLLVTTFDEAEVEFLNDVLLTGAIPPRTPSIDFLSVVHDNAAPTKLDAYLQRNVTYTVRYNPADGSMNGQVSVELVNSATPGLPEYVAGGQYEVGRYEDLEAGTNRIRLSIYTSGGVEGLTVDGEDGYVEGYFEYDYLRWLTFLDVEAGSTSVVNTDIINFLPENPVNYRLVVAAQPVANFDQFRLVVQPTEGWIVSDGTAMFDQTLELTEDTSFAIGFIPSDVPE